MYKFVIAEDDRRIRLLLHRLLTKNFECEVREAANGLEALSHVQADEPDILFLDVEMPIMNGIDTLSALREDNAHSSTLVIILSGANEKSTVAKLISIGIEDFILKPLDIKTAVDRITKVLEKKFAYVKRINDNPALSASNIIKILVIEKDFKFRSMFSEIFETKFKIEQTESGIEGLKAYIGFQPDIVLVGENLTSLNEKMLAYKIKELSTKIQPRLFFISSQNGNRLPNSLYDGSFTKTSNKKLFEANFLRAAFGSKDEFQQINNIISEEYATEYFAALQQVFGIMTGDDIEELPETEPIEENILRYCISFTTPNSPSIIKLFLAASGEVITKTAEKITGEKMTIESGAMQPIKELLSTLAERLKSFFASRGIQLIIEEAVVVDEIKYSVNSTCQYKIIFGGGNGCKYVSSIIIEKQKDTTNE
ncbi:MAG: response regulator [Ignavibacteriaceae bacterium]|nr:response regulator [Ignavibacteriaceae bacterium]